MTWPSRELLLHLAEHLEVPLRAGNELLVAAGYAPVYAQPDLGDPELAQVSAALDLVLAHAEPFPALVVDRHGDLVRANAGLLLLLDGVAPELLEPPVNVLRTCLHPHGLAPRLEDFPAYSSHVMTTLRRQAAALGDPVLLEQHDELAGYPGVAAAAPFTEAPGVVLPVRLRTDEGVLSFLTTIARFGTAADVTTSELALESLFPADEETARRVRARAG